MPSFSSRTIVYKGLLLATQVGSFYDDLRDPDCVSALGLVHQRFSTNTFPSWKLAHPYRFIAHNGEINTVRGNVNWMNARRRTMESELLGPDLDKMWPLIPHGQSDTACLDNALELLLAGGYSLAHAVMMLIPEAWAGNPLMDRQAPRLLRIPRRADGAVGRPRRRGLHRWPPDRRDAGPQRPAPRALPRHRRRPVVMASESGVLPIKEDNIVRKWRLQPGRMLLIDFEQGRIIEDEELKAQLAAERSLTRTGSTSRAVQAQGPRRDRARAGRSCR
jgi:glutamate synthase (NADPH/NADH) large chain